MENKNIPQITSSEIEEWENKFKEIVSPLVQFDTQHGGHSMQIFNGAGGLETNWAGTIVLGGDNYIKWTFSIQNEPFMDSKIKLTEENFQIISKLYNFYITWKDEWAKQVTIPSGTDVASNTDGPPKSMAPGAAGASMNPSSDTLGTGGAPAPVMTGTGGGAMNENKRTANNIRTENRERMLRLAQLWKK